MGSVCADRDGRVVNAASVMMSVKCQTAMAMVTVSMAIACVPKVIRVNSVKKVRKSIS